MGILPRRLLEVKHFVGGVQKSGTPRPEKPAHTKIDRYFEGGSAGARTWAIVNPGGNFSLTSNLMYSMEPG